MISRRDFCLAAGAALLRPGRAGASRPETFRPEVFRNSRGERMPYRLFVPRGRGRREPLPLVLWLHGGAGRGDDNLKQIRGGNAAGSHVWTRPENQSKHPCFVLAPQCPEGEMWATVETAQPTRQLRLALELLENLRQTLGFDARRLYVAGQSLGGFGTWSIITHRPGMFAAAVPVCGGGDEAAAPRLKATPIWAFHGEKDEAVHAGRSRRMVAAVRRAGGSPRYTEYEGAGHVIWERVFGDPGLLPWVFARGLKAGS